MRRTRIDTAPMREWESIYDHHDRNDQRPVMQRADDRACAAAIHAARLSAYLSARLAGKPHAAAVKAQNRTAAKLRKLLGFSYDEPLTF